MQSGLNLNISLAINLQDFIFPSIETKMGKRGKAHENPFTMCKKISPEYDIMAEKIFKRQIFLNSHF